MKLEEYGARGRKEILCIPGLFLSGSCFQELIAQLPEYHFVCVTLDSHHPGSEEYPGREAELDKLAAMLRERGLTHFDLAIGLSLGTIMSVCLAERDEIQIDRLLLDGAVNFYSCGLAAVFEKAAMGALFRSAIRQARGEKVLFPILDQMYVGTWAASSKLCASSMTEPALEILIHELSDFLPKPGLLQPIHCLYGSREQNVAICRFNIRRCFPQATFEIKQGYNHLMFLNHRPEEYAGIVNTVLARPVSG